MARTVDTDDDTPTGSVHIVDLPDPAAAARLPSTNRTTRPVRTRTCCCAGSATCWAAPCGSSLVSAAAATVTWSSGSALGRSRSPLPTGQEALIAFGPLLSDDGTVWLGTAALILRPTQPWHGRS